MNCPYCFEEIKDEALKCKHCGEWIKNPNTLNIDALASNVKTGIHNVEKTLSSIKDAILGPSKYTMPTNDAPFIVEKLMLYGNHLTFKGMEIKYDDILSLYYSYSSASINFISTSRVDLKIFPFKKKGKNYPLDDRDSDSIIHLHTVTSPLMPFFYSNLKKTRIAHAILSEKTFMRRIGYYLLHLIEHGYFHYPKEIKFYKDGTIQKGNKKINLNLAIENNAITEGDNRGFLYNRYSNSFKIEFANEYRMFAPNISTNLYYDADVIKYLLTTYKTFGGFLTEDNMWNYLDVKI